MPFVQACLDHGIEWIHSDPWSHPISSEQNQRMIQESYLAPAICGKIQIEKGYISCRIFKNISYGQLGLINSLEVFNFFFRQDYL